VEGEHLDRGLLDLDLGLIDLLVLSLDRRRVDGRFAHEGHGPHDELLDVMRHLVERSGEILHAFLELLLCHRSYLDGVTDPPAPGRTA
jgi:hypothetical protein